MILLDNEDLQPICKGKSKVHQESLNSYLKADDKKRLICWHKWVYWTFGPSTRLHRVCAKCYKKQKSKDIIIHRDEWIKDKN